MEQELCITGLDASEEMLGQAKNQKRLRPHVIQADIAAYQTEEKYDYIFIPSWLCFAFYGYGLVQKGSASVKGDDGAGEGNWSFQWIQWPIDARTAAMRQQPP